MGEHRPPPVAGEAEKKRRRGGRGRVAGDVTGFVVLSFKISVVIK